MPLKASTLKDVLQSSYKKNKDIDAPAGYTLDRSLSTNQAKVFKSDNSNDVIVAHRGSATKNDWMDNYSYARYGNVKKTDTYKAAKRVQNQAIRKYGADNITSVGHSRAGLYVQELNDRPETKVKSAITYNKAAGVSDLFRKNPKNQTDIRTDKDVVSLLSPLQKHKKDTVTIHHDGFNPISAHTPDDLSKLGDELVGTGIPFYALF
jgi:uncharacterized protein (DUF4415 family)